MERLPEPFVKRIRQQLGDETDAFLASFDQPPPVSIRHGTSKCPSLCIPQETYQDRVPWFTAGVYLSERPIFTLDPYFHAGCYYVQEASSMLLWHILEETTRFTMEYDCLDLCASPGGKSTLLRDYLATGGMLVANDPIRSRIPALRENLIRWGVPNVLLTNYDPEDFARNTPEWFDIVLVDAPCSGEGMFRKDPKAVREWSPENAALCAARQRRILTAARETVAPGGLLIYSTCTYNPAENDENVRFLREMSGFKTEDVDIPEEWGIVRTEEGWQCWPHRVRGEGFYIAVLRRAWEQQQWSEYKGESIRKLSPLSPEEREQAARYMYAPEEGENEMFSYFRDSNNSVLAVYGDRIVMDGWLSALPRVEPLYNIGTFKGKEFIPSHALALTSYGHFRNQEVPKVILNHEQALAYLRKEPFALPDGTPQGWVLAVLSDGFGPGPGIGWLKVMPDRFNNYLPTDWRIRMRG